MKLRYDFYVPSSNTIIEYDGKEYHADDKVRLRDAIKDKFAKDNKIRLIRIVGIGLIEKAIKGNFNARKENKKNVKLLGNVNNGVRFTKEIMHEYNAMAGGFAVINQENRDYVIANLEAISQHSQLKMKSMKVHKINGFRNHGEKPNNLEMSRKTA